MSKNSEGQPRRRSRTVSWDHSVRSDGFRNVARLDRAGDNAAQFKAPPAPLQHQLGLTSPGLRDSSASDYFDDSMSISRGHSVERVRFSASRAHSDENDEDYSASVNAILHKRLSIKKGKHQKQRRSSSPLSSMIPDDASLISDRRRSSAFTTSSGDTAINIEEAGISQEQIFENIRLHKEVLGSVRQQPWSIRRKMKLVQQAKEYVKKHEGQLQERLAMSKSTKDIVARFHILVVKQWQHSKREMANFISQIIPWELTIKEIESQFGTVVASYFTFLRWLFWVNSVISVLLAAFVVIPEILLTNRANTGERKTLLPEEQATSMQLMTILNFEGVLQHSPLFYGYYTSHQSSETGYRLPTAYFVTGLVVYIYSFVATLRKMAANSRLSKLSEKDDECVFTWKLFTGWDYMIGNEETAHNRISSIILGFKEALLEEAERMKDKQNWKVVALRIFANLNMIWMLGSSVYAVILVVSRSTEPDAETTLWRKYEITVVMTLIGTFFPIAFEGLGVLESYHPRTTLRVQLARIMALNLLNLYTLTFALFVKINDMTKELVELKPNITTAIAATTALVPAKMATATVMATTLALMNSTTTAANQWTTVVPPGCHRETVECATPFFFPPPDATPTATAGVATAAPTRSATTVFSQRPEATTAAYPRDRVTDKALTTTEWYPSTSTSRSWSVGPGRRPSSDAANATESAVKPVDNIQIMAVEVTSEDAVTESDATFATYDDDDLSQTGSTADDFTSPSSVVGSTAGPFTGSPAASTFTGSPAASTFTGSPAASTFTESTAVDRADDESVTVTAAELYDDGVTATTTDGRADDKIRRRPSKSRTKRMAAAAAVEVKNKNETNCFRIVCVKTTESLQGPGTSNLRGRKYTGANVSSEAFATTTEYEDAPKEDLSLYVPCMDSHSRQRLRKLCWETMFGQELVKLTVMDLVSTIISTIFVDFARAVFVRYMNRCWCWNLEKRFPQYGDFKIAENILHLVNNQGMVWMGMFFSPGLPIINVVKLMIMMYVRSWAVLTCNVPHDVVFRASRSNNFYLGLLLTMLFLSVLPVGYAIVWIDPSWHCGPFSQYEKIYHIFTNAIKKAVPNRTVHRVLDYIASPAIVIPLLLLLVLIIYYLASLTSSLREANNDLKTQLRRERTEERRKMFQLVNSRKRGDDDYACMDSTLSKWRQIMPESKTLSDGSNIMLGINEKLKPTENDEVLERVRKKLIHIESDDQQQQKNATKLNDHGFQQQLHHHIHQSYPAHKHHMPHFRHHRRPSRSEETRDAAVLRKWKKSKAVLSRRPSTESESSDQSEAGTEIRVVNAGAAADEPAASDGKPRVRPPPPTIVVGSALNVVTPCPVTGMSGSSVRGKNALRAGEETSSGTAENGNGCSQVEQQPVKHKARLKLAQILYKEARRRRQKYVEELQNQQE